MLLGLWFRRATFDLDAQSVTIDNWYFYFFHQRQLYPFSDISHVTYGYVDSNMGSWLARTYDTIDNFEVGLRLRGGEEVSLFTFRGAGTHVNDSPYPDWLQRNEYVLDVTGTQESESRRLVNLLSKMLDVKVDPPRSY